MMNPSDRKTEERRQKSPTNGQMGGAAVLGGVTALAVGGGPIVALAAAGGMVATANNKGTAGDVARLAGGVVTSTGKQINNFNKKHRVVEKTTNGVAKGVVKVLTINPIDVALTTTIISAATVCAIAKVARGETIPENDDEENRSSKSQ